MCHSAGTATQRRARGPSAGAREGRSHPSDDPPEIAPQNPTEKGSLKDTKSDKRSFWEAVCLSPSHGTLRSVERVDRCMARLEEQFGAFVRHHRKRLNLTQPQLAEKIDRQLNAIKNIESGKKGTTFETIDRLAQALEVDPRDLFGGGDFAARSDRDDSLVDIIKLLSPLSEPELAAIKVLVEAGLKLRRT
ncbi:MAG: hypothetical protein B7Z12_13260 [Caulobacter vibrioides]|uniref:HTH cro/C1-type domain-containing protein n=1 Tax=Caulobacter vibrioides TaxID=155892 RepID=A0A258D2B1_CAUVI|nr:MAG: hypothetical protein B7Z12_13260 [Caulobacter vibrioides]